MEITTAQFQQILPRNKKPEAWVPVLNAAMKEFDIAENVHRIAAFLAQVGHESAELTRLEEGLNFTTIAGIRRMWPTRFLDDASATPFVRNPEGLANRVYSNRLGNGDIGSGDGWRYRGRGAIQITGRSNYRDAGAALALPLEAQPDLLLREDQAARSAAWFWKTRGLNALADDRNDDDDDTDFAMITKKICGAHTHLKERRLLWARARSVLGA